MYLTTAELMRAVRDLVRAEGAITAEAAQLAIERAESQLHAVLANRYVVPFDISALPPESVAIIKRLVLYLALKEMSARLMFRDNEQNTLAVDVDDELERYLNLEYRIPSAPLRTNRVKIGNIE